MSIFSEWKDNIVVFRFTCADDIDAPLFEELVDKDWEPEDKIKIIQYLTDAYTVEEYIGNYYSKCEICDRKTGVGNFTQKSDGEWIWFGSLPHYVMYHNIRIPDRLVERIRRNNYKLGK